MSHTYRLVASCPDRVGIVAAVSSFVAELGGWIIEASQHADPVSKWFFMRYEILADSLPCDAEEFRARFAAVAQRLNMQWQIADTAQAQRVVLLASRQSHCLMDILYRWRSGELVFDIPAVISNHEDLRDHVLAHDVPFEHLAVPRQDKAQAFTRLGRLIEQYTPDVIVLARYMQILPAWLCVRFAGQIINIHHSFLPSFVGARPYHQAFDRGVKLIGATCHYVTPELDAGPIIEQDVVRVRHDDTAEDLVRLGRDVERTVLARGLRYHLEHRVLIHGNKTVVFD